MMRNEAKRKSRRALLGVLFCVVMAAGCGKNGGTKGDPNQIVYVAEVQDLDMGEGYIDKVQSRGNNLYGLTNTYNEETQENRAQVIKMDLVSGNQETIDLLTAKEYENFYGFFINEAGNFVLLSSVYREDANRYFLYEISEIGEKVGEKEITQPIKDNGGEYIQSLTGDNQGNLYMLISGSTGNMIILALNADGTVKGKIEYSDYISNLFCDNAGNVYITGWGSTGMAIRKADFASSTIGGEITMENSLYSGSLTFAIKNDGGILLSDGNTLYECELESGKCEKILTWLDCDIFGGNISYFGITDEGKIWTLSQQWTDEERSAELVFLNQTTADKVPQKEVITYGSLWMDSDVQNAIIKFNKSNAEYRITIKEYGREDYEAGLTQLNADLTGSNCPDIIDLSNLTWSQLRNKGILADLYPYMKKDKAFRMEDYQENIIKAYEADGKLYGILPSFTVSALAGSAAKLEGIDRWNIREMLDFAAKYPEAKLFNTTAFGVLSIFISADMERFINWETGECSFNSDEFVEMLEYANTFDKEYTDWQDPNRVGTHEGLSTGKHILLQEYISNISEVQMAEALFDGPVKFIGYPTDNKSGIVISSSGSSYAMSARSKVKDGVWEFFSYLLSDEYQKTRVDGRSWGLPIKKAYIDELCEKAMEKQYDTDENGEQVEISNTTWGYDDIDVSIYASTEAQVAQFKDVIKRAEVLQEHDNQMYNIITEETESFFAGQKSAREAADIIQSRIQIYVNENR